MAIVAMKHLRLLGMESEREALLKAMQDMSAWRSQVSTEAKRH